MVSSRLFVLLFVFALVSAIIYTEEVINSSISMVGRTGDGKSSFCNLLAKYYNYHEQNPFGEGHSVNSHTTAPKTIVIGGAFQITDNPGLMDTNGVNQDEQNIVNIVTHAKSIGNQKGFILVINSEAPKFDGGMRSAVKLLFDSFGPQFLSHLGILFTRQKSDDITSSKEKADEYKNIVSQMTGHDIGHLPFWLVDNHPEDMASFHVPEAYIESIRERNKLTMEQIKAWSAQLKYIEMDDVKFGEYNSTKLIREANEEAERIRLNSINPEKTRGECKETVISRIPRNTLGESFPWGIQKIDWDEVTYRRECRSIFYKVNGEFHSYSEWNHSGDLTKEENRRVY